VIPVLSDGIPGGWGRWRRLAGSRSPTASKVTTGEPNARPIIAATDPPSYWSALTFRLEEVAYRVTDKPNVGIWIHVRDIVVQILRVSIIPIERRCTYSPNGRVDTIGDQCVFQTSLFTPVSTRITIAYCCP
jgi:hypothetical protein